MANIHFSITYKTDGGTYVRIHLNLNGETSHAPMQTDDGEHWHATLQMPGGTEFSYFYEVCDDTGEAVRREEDAARHVAIGQQPALHLADAWTLRPLSAALRTSAFTDCIYRLSDFDRQRAHEDLPAPLTLRLRATPPPEGMRWGVLGNIPALGEWQPERTLHAVRTDTYEFSFALDLKTAAAGFEYKYVLTDERRPEFILWEEGDNRRFQPLSPEAGAAVIASDDAPDIKLAPWRGAGVVIPVFSLRSAGSFGIGDFGDLQSFVLWAASVGMKAVQLLPINDTTAGGTWRDSYPYNGISVFALHPIYIDAREWKHTKAYARHAQRGLRLNAEPAVNYEAVMQLKSRFLDDLFDEIGGSIMRKKGFKEFCAEQAHWLEPYADFCRQRDEYRTANFRLWPEENLRSGEERAAERIRMKHRFVQYLAHTQMRRAHETAMEHGVILKGDIPIGINRDSVPAREDTRLFHFDGQAGAPPDAFARHGQNWGFPTYNWEEMAKDGYAWWRWRFAHTGLYFDAYRIDHVLGFFRIWEIPYGHIYGLLGRFRPALPLTPEEIKGFGFTQNPAALTRPLLTEERLEELSDAAGGWGFKHYFHKNEDGLYELADEVKTQRGVCERVQDERLRTTLCDLIADVLFIEDPDTPGTYHPRIAGQQTDRYALLPKADREAFDRLHEHFFYHRHNAFWAQEAMKKLPAVIRYAESGAGNAASMLPCAEDLGMVPDCVKDVLGQLDVLSLEIQRMPKTYGRRFADLSANPYLSVATIGTHDMPPLRLWWKTDADGRQAYWHEAMHREGEAPADLGAAECESIVAAHLDSPSMLALIALQDYLAMDASLRHPQPEAEQINDPANPDQRWAYRMHLTIEQLAAATDFNEKLRALIEKSGR